MESNCPSKKITTDGVDSTSGKHLAVSFELNSEDAPVPEDTEQHGTTAALQQNDTVSKDLNQLGENFDAVLLKRDSIFVELNDSDKNNTSNSGSNEKYCEAIVKISKPLCADYRSDTETDSVDSESDSSTSTDETTDSSSENERASDDSHDSNSGNSKTLKQVEKKEKGDIAFTDLPPIEDLKISVPENACVEIGKISSIVESLVVVESYKGTPALDVDTVLFLDCGKRTLGKVFDILGPITEPVYTVRFNSDEQIKGLNLEKEQKVYFAPKTQHTMFVFLSEVLKNKGSDASWKDNIEAPPEFQDFSDDEEERLYKNKQKQEPVGENISKEFNNSRKRSFTRTKQPTILHPPSLRYPLLPPHPNIPPYPGTPLLSAPPPPAYAPLPPPPAFSAPPFFAHTRPLQPFHPPPHQPLHPPPHQPLHPPPHQPLHPPPHQPLHPPLHQPLHPPPHQPLHPPPHQPLHPPPHQPLHPPLHQPFLQQGAHLWGRQMFRPPPPPPPPDLQNTNGKY